MVVILVGVIARGEAQGVGGQALSWPLVRHHDPRSFPRSTSSHSHQPDLGHLASATIGPLAGLLAPAQGEPAVGGGRGRHVEFDGHGWNGLFEPAVDFVAVGVEPDQVAEAITGIDDADLVTGLLVKIIVPHLERSVMERLRVLAPGQWPAGAGAEADDRRPAEIRVGRVTGAANQVRLALSGCPGRRRSRRGRDRCDATIASIAVNPLFLLVELTDRGKLPAQPDAIVERHVDRVEVRARSMAIAS